MALVACAKRSGSVATAYIDVILKFLCPAQVYQYDAGFARFCNVKYSSQAGELNNPFIHLTNVAIQKHNDDYNVKHGGKWNLQHVRLFVEACVEINRWFGTSRPNFEIL